MTTRREELDHRRALLDRLVALPRDFEHVFDEHPPLRRDLDLFARLFKGYFIEMWMSHERDLLSVQLAYDFLALAIKATKNRTLIAKFTDIKFGRLAVDNDDRHPERPYVPLTTDNERLAFIEHENRCRSKALSEIAAAELVDPNRPVIHSGVLSHLRFLPVRFISDPDQPVFAIDEFDFPWQSCSTGWYVELHFEGLSRSTAQHYIEVSTSPRARASATKIGLGSKDKARVRLFFHKRVRTLNILMGTCPTDAAVEYNQAAEQLLMWTYGFAEPQRLEMHIKSPYERDVLTRFLTDHGILETHNLTLLKNGQFRLVKG